MNKKIIFTVFVGFFLGVVTIAGSKIINNNQNSRLSINNIPLSNTAAVDVASYQSLTEIDGLTDQTGDGLNVYLSNMYRWGISIAVILAILMIILGGIQYMTTDSFTNKQDGITKIKGALAGLILALSSYLILETINPQLVNLERARPGEVNLGGSTTK
jgi:TRAP-type C4-dicarboxylate transport system permease small subunit